MIKRMPSQNLQDWIAARKRFQLSHAHVQMARELGMNPRKLGKLDNHEQEPWKAPLPQFIEHLYVKRFGRERPEVVMSVEEQALAKEAARAARKAERRRARVEVTGPLKEKRDEGHPSPPRDEDGTARAGDRGRPNGGGTGQALSHRTWSGG